MERTDAMKLNLEPLSLDDAQASPEEAATTGILSISANDTTLTEGLSFDDEVLRAGPLVSAYPLAEWLAWNWWRLRWEPTPPQVNRHWAFAHRLSSIGGGYRWPNLELVSDGERVRLFSAPSAEPCAGTFRYVGAPRSEAVTADAFESAVDAFVQAALDRLGKRLASASNLQTLADSLDRDRADVGRNSFRRIEAMLGHDPGEGDAEAIRRLLADAPSLGEQAVFELAAGATSVAAPALRETLKRVGFDFRPQDAVTVDMVKPTAQWGTTAAWRVGVALARQLREMELPNGKPVTNGRLAEMAGVPERALSDTGSTSDGLSFEWETAGQARVAFRSKWVTGRRFDLARLMAERLLSRHRTEPLRAVTKSYTYRQKAQRAFAAEFLAPIDAVDAFLAGDCSEERQTEAAQHFQISSYAIQSLLVNNRRLSRPGALDAFDCM